ncbi:transketolase [Nesidiocoris tenuis]|uniref:transketolase n=1 Tax=Nesidiocoris tenuis TaxID=355587 RepID=A0ABN7AGU6_9HEMI|nr:transketolase [Nesidiocoris tenuis]
MSPSLSDLQDLAHKLRIHSINATQASNSGHPTSCASIAEVMSVLFFNTMKLDLKQPIHPSSDRFILSKGHAAPILYAAWAEAGLFPVSELLNLRKFGNDLEGHPTPRLNFIDVGTGSLGQGLSVGCGMAYVGKYYDQASYRVYVLVGDGESAEGSIWEALNFASHYKLDNLCVIFDINRLGQSEPTCLQHDMETYRKRVDAFGFNAIVVDGHDVGELIKAFDEASATKGKPTALLLKTYKGKHFPNIEDLENWHGKPLGTAAKGVLEHLNSLIRNKNVSLKPKPVTDDAPKVSISNIRLSAPPDYEPNAKIATRAAYGNAIAKIGKNNARVIALDGDTKNSTFSEKIKSASVAQYIECFIAEQNLVGVGMGVTCRDRTVAYVSTFATFFTRAFDQIRMGAISQSNLNFVGSHCGASIGEDGPSQMGLEDIALFRAIPGSTVIYPSDATSTERAVELVANTKGICYIRTSRPNTPILYDANTKFELGRSLVLRQSNTDKAVIVTGGVTLHEALKAHQQLAQQGINVRVVDIFSVKPLDVSGLKKNVTECGGNVVVVEDHYAAGGIGEAVSGALAQNISKFVHIAVTDVPRSGPPEVLLAHYKLDAQGITDKIKAALA